MRQENSGPIAVFADANPMGFRFSAAAAGAHFTMTKTENPSLAPFAPAPVTLVGKSVRLEPLALGHLDGLCEVGLDPALWQWMPNQVATRDDMRREIEEALEAQARGVALPFVTVLAMEGKVVGTTRFGNIEPRHRRAEIGWTWVARPWQRTAVNTEAKWLMLRHAFETWQCARVELKTDSLNEKSRRAIRRLGAVEEGTLRKHMLTSGGRWRDTVYYSILAAEWPAVSARLLAALSAAR